MNSKLTSQQFKEVLLYCQSTQRFYEYLLERSSLGYWDFKLKLTQSKDLQELCSEIFST